MVKLQSEVLGITPAQESLMDKLSFIFTSDKSIAEKIGNMLNQMRNLSQEDQKKFESLHLGRKVLKADKLQELINFSAQAIDFCVANLKKYESMSYAVMETDRDKIRQEISQMVENFESQNKAEEVLQLMKTGMSDRDDYTYAQLGYTFEEFTRIANEFKTAQAGRLATMKKMRLIAYISATKLDNWQIRVAHEATYRFKSLLTTSIDVYKYVDEFLFFSYNKLLKEKIIEK